MRNLILDVNIVVDICSGRAPYALQSADAVAKCRAEGIAVWLYAGSVQTLEFVLASELLRLREVSDKAISRRKATAQARRLLTSFCRDVRWLAALAGEGDVFEADDPEDEQLLRALDRFAPNEAALLSRDRALIDRAPGRVLSPDAFLCLAPATSLVQFVDLKTQQDATRPHLEQRVHRVLHHGQYIMGPEVRELEQKLAAYVGVKHAIGCSSGTDALLLPLLALGIGPGDAVFTTPFTFIATAEVISLLGATPVFVDIDPLTYNIDPKQLDKAIRAVKANDPSLHPLPVTRDSSPVTRDPSPVTRPPSLTPKAVIAVDLYGLPADYDALQAVCTEHGLALIEDAAQSFGAEYKGKMACAFGDAAATSFFPAKPLGCYGDGGMVFTDRDDLAEICRSLLVHGKGTDKYDNVRIGLNARLDTLQAAVVLAKLEVFPEEVEKRQAIARAYTEALASNPALRPPHVPEGLKSGWAQYTVRAPNGGRGGVEAALKVAGVPSVVYYPKPLHLQTAFAPLGYRAGDFPESERASAEVLSLPFGPYLARDAAAQIAAVLRGAPETA